MSASEARKLARTALGMAPAGGIREELRADLEAAEAEFARRLKVSALQGAPRDNPACPAPPPEKPSVLSMRGASRFHRRARTSIRS